MNENKHAWKKYNKSNCADDKKNTTRTRKRSSEK